MSRHPYTYSCDFIRSKVECNPDCPISRADASVIRSAIAKVIGIDDHDLAVILSNAYQEENK